MNNICKLFKIYGKFYLNLNKILFIIFSYNVNYYDLYYIYIINI